MSRKQWGLFCIALLVILELQAQDKGDRARNRQEKKTARREQINKLIRQEEEGELVFHKQRVIGFKMATDGYGFSFELGKYKNNASAILYQFDLNEKRHQKEKKISLFDGFGFSNIIFGKMNNFYQAKLGVVKQNRIGGKGNKNGVSVSGMYGGGFSLGLVKPYYVNINLPNGEAYRSSFPKIIDSNYAITGAAGALVGWKDVKINPGAHAKAAMRFDYGRFRETVTAIEIGLTAEMYGRKVEQLAYVDPRRFFFNSYISIIFGRRN